MNATVARAPNPLLDEERTVGTVARAPNPLITEKKKKKPDAPSDDASEDPDYETGQSYAAREDDADGEASESRAVRDLSLDGDGLEPVDPELVPRTRALPALQIEEQEAEEEAAEADAEEGADDENATRAGPPVKLEIIEGPDKGKKVRFKGVRMVVGRTPGVDLQLKDPSASRRHFELVHSDKGTLLRDLGSGNGTKLNGSKVAEQLLTHGDEIAIGKTKLRFIDEMAAFNKARQDAAAAAEESEDGAEAGADEGAEAADGDAGGSDDDAANESAGEGDDGAAASANSAEDSKKSRRTRAPVRTSRADAPKVAGGRVAVLVAKFRALPKRIQMISAAAAALLIIMIAAKIAFRPPPPPPEDPNVAPAEQKMQDGRTALREGRYNEAAKLFEEAEGLVPGIDKGKLGARAKQEVAVLDNIEAVKKLAGEHKFDEARKQLESGARSQTLGEELEKTSRFIAEAEIQYWKERVNELIATGDIDEARTFLEKLPPEHRAIPQQKIDDFQAQLDKNKKEEDRIAAMDARARRAHAALKAAQDMEVAFSVVERKFAGQEWERAASECSRVIEVNGGRSEIIARARKVASQIPNFGRNYDEGMKKFKQGQLGPAAKPLRIAYQLYQQMGLKQNRFEAELIQNLAQSSLIAGKDALARNDLENAAHFFGDAARLDPSEAKARQGLDEVASRADELYGIAYAQKDLDQAGALKKMKIVVAVTPPGSATHEKAKNAIAAMSP